LQVVLGEVFAEPERVGAERLSGIADGHVVAQALGPQWADTDVLGPLPHFVERGREFGVTRLISPGSERQTAGQQADEPRPAGGVARRGGRAVFARHVAALEVQTSVPLKDTNGRGGPRGIIAQYGRPVVSAPLD